MFQVLHRTEEALTLMEKAIRIGRQHHETWTKELAELLSLSTILHFQIGNVDTAIALGREGYDLSIVAGATNTSAYTAHILGWAYLQGGQVTAGIEMMERAIAHATETGKLHTWMAGPYCLATALSQARRFEDAQVALNQTREIAQRVGSKYYLGLCDMMDADIVSTMGRYEEAQVIYREAVTRLEALNTSIVFNVYLHMGHNAYMMGEIEEAVVLLERGMEGARDAPDHMGVLAGHAGLIACRATHPDEQVWSAVFTQAHARFEESEIADASFPEHLRAAEEAAREAGFSERAQQIQILRQMTEDRMSP